jgi:signal transduction histidine kinase
VDTGFESNKFFHRVDPRLAEELGRIAERIEFEPDSVVFDEGDAGDALYLVLSGCVKISKRGRGGQQETLTYLTAGEYFGEMALFDPAPRSARATVVEPAVLGRVDAPRLELILSRAPVHFHVNLTVETIKRLREADRLLIEELLAAERLSLVGSMAAMVIHDFKNPISVIHGAAQLLEKEASAAPTIARPTAMITHAVDSMLEMMQDLLDFSRGRTEIQVEPVPVSCITDELEDQALRWLGAKGITVEREIAASGVIFVDPGRLLRALINIVKNAAEVMAPGGVLRFGVRREHGFVAFVLSDTGPGIPEDLLPRIFDPFVTQGKPFGTGLGLAIARAAVEAHGGTISVATARERGTTFTVRVPDSHNA